MVFIGVVLTAIIYPLIEGRTDGWPAWTFVSLAAGALLLAADLVGPALDALKLEAGSVRGPWKGKDLAELKFRHPFLDLAVPAVLADYVTLDQGTGIVHTAAGHGVDRLGDDPQLSGGDPARLQRRALSASPGGSPSASSRCWRRARRGRAERCRY